MPNGTDSASHATPIPITSRGRMLLVFAVLAAAVVLLWLAPDARTMVVGGFTLAMYREMGIEECVAASPRDYVDIALRLGREPAYREELSRRIAQRSARLFDRPEAGRALGEAITRLWETARP